MRTFRTRSKPEKKKGMIKKYLFILTALTLALFVSSCAGSTSERSNITDIKTVFEEKDDIVIDCLGDSITWGLYDSPLRQSMIAEGKLVPSTDDGGQYSEEFDAYVSSTSQSDPTYPKALETKLNEYLEGCGLSDTVKVYNDGICGDWVTKDSYKRISCSPDVVIMLYCGNNYLYDMPLEGVMEENIDALRKNDCVVYLANYLIAKKSGLPGIFEKANKHIKEVSEKTDTPLIDINALVKNGGYDMAELFSPDDIHLSRKGYELIGTLIAEAIFNDIRE